MRMDEQRKRMPTVTIVLIALNVLVFLFSDLILYDRQDEFVTRFALNPILVMEAKQYYRLLTAMFLHFNIEHIMSNMLMLAYAGTLLERGYGWIRYLFLYFFAGLLAGLASILYNGVWTENYFVFAAGASGAIYGLMGAMVAETFLSGRQNGSGLRRRDLPVLLLFVIVSGFFQKGVDQAAHIGGFLAGLLFAAVMYVIWRLRHRSKGAQPR